MAEEAAAPYTEFLSTPTSLNYLQCPTLYVCDTETDSIVSLSFINSCLHCQLPAAAAQNIRIPYVIFKLFKNLKAIIFDSPYAEEEEEAEEKE